MAQTWQRPSLMIYGLLHLGCKIQQEFDLHSTRLQLDPLTSFSLDLPPRTFPSSEYEAILQDSTVISTPFTRLLVGREWGVMVEKSMQTLHPFTLIH